MARFMSYGDQLRQPEWYAKRAEILERDGHACKSCGVTEQLNVHHGYYEKGKMAWEYENETLHTLCRGCHLDTHEVFLKLHQLIGQLHPAGLEAAVFVIENRLMRQRVRNQQDAEIESDEDFCMGDGYTA